ncbi:hypothetical protein H2199_000662 [Coniosporium tulheliwenetii]|uniref:Uncharacterized protein n=1 Tax=Coniosporium tulheliwenetii TaxID=3383036 RepID=A0ACC2ZMJ6_9PEZI|nr:hypothetical protein H2199_000662 [Cladosporium sp. JES 115]
MSAVSLQEHGRRRSVFKEIGLLNDDPLVRSITPQPVQRPLQNMRLQSTSDISVSSDDWDEWEGGDAVESDDEPSSTINSTGMTLLNSSKAHPSACRSLGFSTFHRLGILALVLLIAIPILHNTPILGKPEHTMLGARGGVIRRDAAGPAHVGEHELLKRQDTQTSICKRWSHQSAVVNGTLWVYGGRKMTDASQTSNHWNNDFLTYDLTNSWQISSPAVTGLPVPQYDILASEWIEHRNPQTSAGENAVGAGQPVQRSAEGAGAGVAAMGRGWYFGGHLDTHTTEGWSNQVARIYLKSLLEFTFPGFSNSNVETLSNGQVAGEGGVWRNITEGGLQDEAGFTERADGILVYIPGFGEEGILLGLAGGDTRTFTQMNVIDVYDIATSTWYKQATDGPRPKERVNPCAVVAAAADGSSYNVYMWAGQNLQPAGEQIQYDDMWILSLPAFTWIQVDQTNQPVPYGRSGHTCHIWDGQMVVVGGYVGQELSCDSPGVYVFNLSSLEWTNQYTAISGFSNAQPGASGDPNNDSEENLASNNPFSQQLSQRGSDIGSGLEGSYGYAVPEAVISVIGGSPTGGATVTVPMQSATAGPMATGRAITYTVTASDGSTITATAVPNPDGSYGRQGGGGPNIGAIVAGVVAGLFFLVACYFAFCAWVYRKQLILYKNHVAMAQRNAADPSRAEKDAFLVPESSAKTSSDRRGPDGVKISSESASAVTASAGAGSARANGRPGAAAAGVDGIYPTPTRDALGRSSSAGSSTDDLLAGQEPTFWGTKGVLLNPRRSLRVINRD